MPFRPAFRWSPQRAQPSALAADLHRLCADPRVHRLFEWFGRHEREIAEFRLAITAVAAPPFGEHARAAWLSGRLAPLGLAVSSDAAGNLLAARPVTDVTPGVAENSAEPKPFVAVSAHLDTVFPAATPLPVRREHDRLLGPGISDNGAGLAALWALAAAFEHVGLRTNLPLLFLANVGEEGEGDLRGIRHIYRDRLRESAEDLGLSRALPNNASRDNALPNNVSRDNEPEEGPAPQLAALIALDGAGTASIVAQALGSRRFEIAISGPGGHSWSDYGAPNAILAASLAVAALSRLSLPSHPRATLNVGSFEGGTSVNAIPARAVIKVDLRSADPAQLDEFERQLRRAVAQACAEAQPRTHNSPAARLLHTIAIIGSRPAGELPASSPLLAAIRAVDAQLGIHSQVQLASTDANIPLALGLEAVSLGAGGSGGGAHTLAEWFDPAGREQALQRLALLLLLLAGLAPESA